MGRACKFASLFLLAGLASCINGHSLWRNSPHYEKCMKDLEVHDYTYNTRDAMCVTHAIKESDK